MVPSIGIIIFINVIIIIIFINVIIIIIIML